MRLSRNLRLTLANVEVAAFPIPALMLIVTTYVLCTIEVTGTDARTSRSRFDDATAALAPETHSLCESVVAWPIKSEDAHRNFRCSVFIARRVKIDAVCGSFAYGASAGASNAAPRTEPTPSRR